MFKVEKRSYSSSFVNYAEIARYAGSRQLSDELKTLIDSCLSECDSFKAVNYMVCFSVVPVKVEGSKVDFSAFSVNSRNLADLLAGSESALIFASTIGMGIDRLIKKYSEINPSRALIFQSIGAERVETITDVFIEVFKKENSCVLSPRFSAGYGDLPLETQTDVFNLLSPGKHLGLTLNDSLLMSPSKSITALAGINGALNETANCRNCTLTDCEFKK